MHHPTDFPEGILCASLISLIIIEIFLGQNNIYRNFFIRLLHFDK